MNRPLTLSELVNALDAEWFLLKMDQEETTAEFAETVRPYCKQTRCEMEYIEELGFSHRVRHDVRALLEFAKQTGYAPVKEIVRPFQSMGLGDDGCCTTGTTEC